jgi:hypothetical protein
MEPYLVLFVAHLSDTPFEHAAIGDGSCCKNLDNSYFSLSLKAQVMVGTMEDSRYAINGKLWEVKKGYKQQRTARTQLQKFRYN